MPRQIIFGLIAAPIAAPAGRADDGRPAARHALLVGCTAYPGLPPGYQLSGSANDVHRTARLLKDPFRFTDEDLTLLVHDAPDRRPTRANIVRAFESLIARA